MAWVVGCAPATSSVPDDSASVVFVVASPPPVHSGLTTTPWVPPEEPTEPQTMEGFSFIDDTLAGMPLPWGDDLGFLATQGVALLVSARETPVDPAELRLYGLDGYHLPIDDFEAPTPEQQDTFVALVRERRANGERVGVHCLAGLGRTGTLLATWLVSEGWTAADAVAEVRAQRPGSIESAAQEASVYAYELAVAQ